MLESFAAGAKPKIIREVKSIVPNLTLIDVCYHSYYSRLDLTNLHSLKAKKFVESLPQVVKESVPREEAEKMKAAFEALGAVVKLD